VAWIPKLQRGGYAWRWAVYGGVLGLGAPAGLAAVLAIAQPSADMLAWWVYGYTGVSTIIVFALFGLLAGTLMNRLRAAATHDGLTGLANRRLLVEMLPRVLANARRRRRSLCVLMLDLDHFKRVNDQFGHAVGDQTLRAVADVLRAEVRAGDFPARYGGEEFVVVCEDAESSVGMEIAERLREAVSELEGSRLGHPTQQTVSIGVAELNPADGDDVELLLRRADAALYRAKNEGRDRVVLAPSPGDAGDSGPERASLVALPGQTAS
jgi:diguanylate cyclase (GGDEF)-like protein